MEENNNNFSEETMSDPSVNQIFVNIIEGYENVFNLSEEFCPRITGEETLINKIKFAEDFFGRKQADGEMTEKAMIMMSRETDRLNLRLCFLMADLIATKGIVMVPAKRNYMYVGRERLIHCLETLTLYENIRNVHTASECLVVLIDSLSKAKSDTENLIEFRLLTILALNLLNFNYDLPTISFISQFILSQIKLVDATV